MLRLYMDVHVKAAITAGLRRRGIEVLTAQEDGGTRLEDAALPERATMLQRVLCSQDDDLLAVARERQAPDKRALAPPAVHPLDSSRAVGLTPRNLGSSTSRRASPSRLNPNTAMKMARQLGMRWRPMRRADGTPMALAATIYSVSFTDNIWDRTVWTTGVRWV